MTGPAALLVVMALAGFLVGVALGWYLRRANAWCPRCGGGLSCRGCGGRASWGWFPPNQRWER